MPRRVRLELLVSHVEASAFRKVLVLGQAVVRLAGRLATGRVDVLHLHSSSRGSFVRKSVLAAMGRAARVPVVFHLHSGAFDEFYNGTGRRLRWWIRRTLESSTTVIALSEDWAERLRLIAPRALIRVVSNGVVVSNGDRAYRQAGYALFLGRMSEGKGVFDLLHAVARLPGVRLVLAGDGEADRVRELARELDMAGRVEVHGWVHGEDKTRLLDGAALFVLPSYREGLPMALLEAMAAGVPVVVSPVGGVGAVVTDRETGLLVPPGDRERLAASLASLWADEALRERLGKAGRAVVAERFGVEHAINALVSLYAEIGAR